MSQLDYCYCDESTDQDIRDSAKALEVEYQVRLYSPHPEMRMVVILEPPPLDDRFIPLRMVNIANHAVRVFNLNPSQVVWIEHTPGKSESCPGFHLINFDWQAGQATTSHRSPIYEDWYLSWLEAELQPQALRQ